MTEREAIAACNSFLEEFNRPEGRHRTITDADDRPERRGYPIDQVVDAFIGREPDSKPHRKAMMAECGTLRPVPLIVSKWEALSAKV
jgi:hypothetical protein